ncbi:hypothetical protein AALP_AA3G156300 [Arabis alpina]|uniref:Protein BIG GRAIN 1-like B n=1 Tax=Arabis alpina TaxID=50452 RepID=A0A087H9F1_ARAAL|nr:hypothetical protein AALP_AA3G156300 [Arabis alpina]
MEMAWENMPVSSSSRHHHHQRNPSFSSTLLDQIYRSIDDSPPNKNHHQHRNPSSLQEDREISPLVFHRRSIAADFDRSTRRATGTTTVNPVFLRYSNSTSSDSSGFSSSESKSSASPRSTRQPKPIRTSVDNSCVQKANSKQDLGGFLRTKSKALKIYTDLKKVKQPISPGGKLATFLNSLFTNTNTNTKKSKKTTTAVVEPQSATTTTTCSSASSFSRSCLSKTPSSSGKSKRSVRFCPVNVILDEEYSSSVPMPYVYTNNNDDYKHHRRVMEEENRRVIEAAKDLLRTYQLKNKDHLVVTTTMTKCENVQEEDDYDDAASCASSDLFELENLSAIGIERYGEELPVYETTRMDNTNRAIATRLIV